MDQPLTLPLPYYHQAVFGPFIHQFSMFSIPAVPSPGFSYFPSSSNSGPNTPAVPAFIAASPLIGSGVFQSSVVSSPMSYDFLGLSAALSTPVPALNAVGWPITGAAGATAAAAAAAAAWDAAPPLNDASQLLAVLTANQLSAFEAIVRSVRTMSELAAKCAPIATGYAFTSLQPIDSCSCVQPESLSPLLHSIPATKPRELSIEEQLMLQLERLIDTDDTTDYPDYQEEEELPVIPEERISQWQSRCLESEDYLDEPLESDEESELAELMSLDGEEKGDLLPTDESPYWQAAMSTARASFSSFRTEENRSSGRGLDRGRVKRRVADTEYPHSPANEQHAFRLFQERNRMDLFAESNDDFKNNNG